MIIRVNDKVSYIIIKQSTLVYSDPSIRSIVHCHQSNGMDNQLEYLIFCPLPCDFNTISLCGGYCFSSHYLHFLTSEMLQDKVNTSVLYEGKQYEGLFENWKIFTPHL